MLKIRIIPLNSDGVSSENISSYYVFVVHISHNKMVFNLNRQLTLRLLTYKQLPTEIQPIYCIRI